MSLAGRRSEEGPAAPFHGAKAALFHAGQVLCYLRDDKPGLPFPGRWDLPGGGREGAETPEACFLRELEEEFGLRLPAARLEWCGRFPDWRGSGESVFFAGRLLAEDIAAIRFGDEGQCWQMMDVDAFIRHPLGIAHFQERVRLLAPRFARSRSGET